MQSSNIITLVPTLWSILSTTPKWTCKNSSYSLRWLLWMPGHVVALQKIVIKSLGWKVNGFLQCYSTWGCFHYWNAINDFRQAICKIKLNTIKKNISRLATLKLHWWGFQFYCSMSFLHQCPNNSWFGKISFSLCSKVWPQAIKPSDYSYTLFSQ